MRREKKHSHSCHKKGTPTENQSRHPEEKLGLSLFCVIIFPMIEQFCLSLQEMVSFNLSAISIPVFWKKVKRMG